MMITTHLPPPHGSAAPEVALPGGITPGLLRARAHELCGPARLSLAVLILGQCRGAVVWILPAWRADKPYACGLSDHMAPDRLLLAQVRREEDLQWCAEEALRSGAAPAVVVEMPKLPDLTAVRRLHLAAQVGAEAAAKTGAGTPPLCLILTAGDGGAQGVETRWHMRATALGSAPAGEGESAWRLERRRARTAPVAAWALTRTGARGLCAEPVA